MNFESWSGGQFASARGGQFGSAKGGHIKSAVGGQVDRRLQFLSKVALKLSIVHLSGGGWALGAVGQN